MSDAAAAPPRELHPAHLLAAFDRHVPGALYAYRREAGGRARILYASAGVHDIYGHSPAALLARPRLALDCVHPADRAALQASVLAAFASGGAWKHEFRVHHPTRGLRHIAGAADAEHEADGALTWYGHLLDITDIKRADAERLDLIRRYQDAIELIGDGAWFYDPEQNLFSFSASWRPMLDCDADERSWNQMDWIGLIEPGYRQAVLDATSELVAGRTSMLSVEYPIRGRDGAYLWLHARGAAIERHADGRARLLSGTFTDISARKAAERRIRVQARVIDAAPIGLFVADAAQDDFPLLYANPACRRLFALPADGFDADAPGLVALARHPDEARALLCAEVAARREGRHLWRYPRADGEHAWLRITTSLLEADSDEPRMIGIVEDVTEDFDMREGLVRAREEAVRANEAKSRFIAHVSHELRTPLHGIMGLSELTAADDALPAHAREHAEEIHRAARHLLHLIGDVIDLSAMEAGRLALSIETVPVARVVDSVLRMALPVANEHGIALLADERLRERLWVRADSTRAAQILLNLVSNGIKYNHRGGSVALRLLAGPAGMLRIGVEDTGSGLPPDALERLFEQFNRLGREMSAIEGSGIGLTIARSLAEAMGGALGVTSTAGAGSTFWVDLPDAGEIALQEPVYAAAPVAAHTPVPADTALPALRVLVAEDNVLSQGVFVQQLARLGCQATVVGDGLGAWEAWQRDGCDVLLTDVHMPGLDGLALAARIRAAELAEGRARTCIIGVSANAMKEAERSALVHGMDGYVTKPVTLAALRDVLARVPAGAPRDPSSVAARAAPAQAETLDLRQLELYVGSDPAVLAVFVEQLAATLEDTAAALQVALHAGALATAGDVAHRLKATAHSAGARALGQLCEAIEADVARGDGAALAAHAATLEVCMARIAQALVAQRALGTTPD